ncbi:sulfatase-like hydrolase/transferase [haloarchaeon 3A1-DGR]|nr:sulfatase-like hydrolase/transferase [haloarchaeon 3A1-DGR]
MNSSATRGSLHDQISKSAVLITVDCLRADHVGCYGYERDTTPRIDEFCKDATVFLNSYANSPGTRWALQTIHMGVWSNQIDGLGVTKEGYPLARQFQKNGFKTAAFANNGFLSEDYGYDCGFDVFKGVKTFADNQGKFERMTRVMDSIVKNVEGIIPFLEQLYRISEKFVSKISSGHLSDRETVEYALDWIDSKKAADEPFFAWIHLMDAHTPYKRHDDHLKEIRGDTDVSHVVHPGRTGDVTPGIEPPDRVIDAYDTGIRSADQQIGRILDRLDDDTTVVLTGDHGEEFGEFGEFHEASVYSSFTQVPLIVRDTNMEKGTTETPAQHLDIPPTLCRSLHIPIPEQWVGEPLQDTKRGTVDPLFFQIEDEYAVRTDEWKLISDEEHRLYRVSHMKSEKNDITSEYPDVYDRLQELLVEHQATMADTEISSKISGYDGISQEVENNLDELGYL